MPERLDACPMCGSTDLEVAERGDVIVYTCKDCGYKAILPRDRPTVQ